MDKRLKLGVKAKSTVTGFKGILTAKVEYLNGCVQFCIKPPIDKDGKEQDGVYYDIQEIEYVGKGINRRAKETGGPQTDSPKH